VGTGPVTLVLHDWGGAQTKSAKPSITGWSKGSLDGRVRTPYSTYILVEAGTQRYNVGTDTPKLWATSLGGVPEESNFLAALTWPSVIRRFGHLQGLVALPLPIRRVSVR
jgi:hypothetical protein